MDISKTAVGALAGLCIVAGAGGAYFATRSDAPVDDERHHRGAARQPDPSASAVDESEAIVADDSPAPVASARRRRRSAPRQRRARTAPAPAPAPTRARRATPRRRRVRRRAAGNAIRSRRREPTSRASPRRRALDPVQPREREREPEPEPVRAVEPPQPEFEELIVLAADSVVGLQVETSISSERARVEDEVLARVTRDVRVGDRVAIPAGSKAHGEVTLVERGGRREGARAARHPLHVGGARRRHADPARDRDDLPRGRSRSSARAPRRSAAARLAARSSAASWAARKAR